MDERAEDVRSVVREHYTKVASGAAGCAPGCCGASPDASEGLGYSAEERAAVPDGSNLGLGCGNPQAIAALRVGESVLDLGSGAGFDCFLAARQVGATGRVVGVDMTATMVAKARENARKIAVDNVDFRLGEIERLPVEDASIDVVLSNCVINLSPEKDRVFREAFRVLRGGGRLAIADIVLLAPLPHELRERPDFIAGCVGGAASVEEIARSLEAAGFEDVSVSVRPESAAFIRDWFPGSGAERYIASAVIEGTRPKATKACCGPACCKPEGASA